MTIREELDRWTAEHEREMVEELKNWVSIPSVSRADLRDDAGKAPYGPDVRRMLDHALKRAQDFGFRTEDHDGYCGSAWYGDAEEEIGFIAHLDVVPEGQGWIYEPYSPVEKDGFIIGRGCSDNKNSGVIGLYLMRFLKEHNIHLNRSFRLMMGCAEETGMDDFRTYQEKGGKIPGFGIVADCSFPCCVAQKGGWNADISLPAGDVISFTAGNVRNAIPDLAEMRLPLKGADIKPLASVPGIEVREEGQELVIISHGKGGHAAFPQGADNAVVKLCRAVIEKLPEGFYDLEGVKFIASSMGTPDGAGMGFMCSDEITGPLTSNIGVVSEENGKLICLLDVRYPVKCDIEKLTEGYKQLLKNAGGTLQALDIEKPFYIPEDDPSVTILQEVYAEVTGDTESKPYTMGGGTYSRVIPNAISFGPGLHGNHQDFLPEGHGGAHGPDEVLNIENWLKAFKIYVLSVMKLGGAEV